MSHQTILCPNQECQRALQLPATAFGQRVRCRLCGHSFEVPPQSRASLNASAPSASTRKTPEPKQAYSLALNHEQRIAAEFNGGHVLVLAGAGTGKTRTIIARAAHLIRTGVDPARILIMTFTRRAALELTQRLESCVGPASSRVTAGTFHHFCLMTMRRMARPFGIEAATIIDRDDAHQLMKLARGSVVVPKEPFPKAKNVADLYSYARNTNRPAREYLDKHTDHDAATVAKLCQVFTIYEARKQKNAYLDYDDILHRFASVIHERSDIRDHFAAIYDHILVDEMQDTNPLQWLILDGLHDPGKLFCVGDDAQSIYSFRGADFKNVHSFTQRLPGSTILRLEENYRSTQEILDVANWLLRRSPLNYDKELRAHRGPGINPRLIEFETDFQEADWVVDDLITRFNDGATWRDHMILTRTAYGSRVIEAALIEKRIPYRFIGGMTLLQSTHVKDLLSLIRCVASHRDELAWVRYLTLWENIGDVTAHRLISGMSRLTSGDEALRQLRVSLVKRPEILVGLDIVRTHWDTPTRAIGEAAHFLEPLLETHYKRWDSRRKDFDLLVRIAERHQSLLDFLETYTLEPITASSVERLDVDDAVLLITVHSAKGTEAKVCYLIRVEPGMYPHVRALGNHDEEEEERRVLYVAMTRAKDELVITRSNSYKSKPTFWGGTTGAHSSGGTSYFLLDLPNQLVDIEVKGFAPLNYVRSEVITPTPPTT